MPDIEIPCPHCGKHSSDPDFCSECGKPITAGQLAPDAVQLGTPQSTAADVCPDCGEPRPGPHARFCDNCRYDFLDRKSFSAVRQAPAAQPQPADAQQAKAPDTVIAVAVPAALSSVRWEIVAVIDPSLRQPDSPEAPSDSPERVFPLVDENLIGRRSDKQNIFPAIPLDADTGVSRRHAMITRNADGSLTLLDLNSSNGTRLNAAVVEANVPTPLVDGDTITLGLWSRLTVRAH